MPTDIIAGSGFWIVYIILVSINTSIWVSTLISIFVFALAPETRCYRRCCKGENLRRDDDKVDYDALNPTEEEDEIDLRFPPESKQPTRFGSVVDFNFDHPKSKSRSVRTNSVRIKPTMSAI